MLNLTLTNIDKYMVEGRDYFYVQKMYWNHFLTARLCRDIFLCESDV